MKWRELRHALKQKTDSAPAESGTRHDRIWVEVDGMTVGSVLLSRGSDDMKNREIGNCARSMGLKEGPFRTFVACTMSRDDYANVVRPTSDEAQPDGDSPSAKVKTPPASKKGHS